MTRPLSFDSLTLDEMNEALEKGVETRDGHPYDIVGFDACLMGSLETAEALSDYAEWMVASEEIEAGAGWDYGPIVAAMGSDGANARSVSTAICDGYQAKSAKWGKDAYEESYRYLQRHCLEYGAAHRGIMPAA